MACLEQFRRVKKFWECKPRCLFHLNNVVTWRYFTAKIFHEYQVIGLYSMAWRLIFLNLSETNWKRWIPKMESLHGKCVASSPWYSHHMEPVGSCSLIAETSMLLRKGSFYGNLNSNDTEALMIKGNTWIVWRAQWRSQNFTVLHRKQNFMFSTIAQTFKCFSSKIHWPCRRDKFWTLLVNLPFLIILPATLQHASLP